LPGGHPVFLLSGHLHQSGILGFQRVVDGLAGIGYHGGNRKDTMKRLLLIVLLLVPLKDAAAQKLPSIRFGTRVRVTFRYGSVVGNVSSFRYGLGSVVGNVVSLNADRLAVRTEGGLMVIPRASITKFEVRWESRGCTGAGMGFFAGAVTLAGYCGYQPSTCKNMLHGVDFISDRGFADLPGIVTLMLVTTVAGGAIGSAVGAVYDSTVPGWKEVPLPLRVGLLPHGGVQVAVRFEFGR